MTLTALKVGNSSVVPSLRTMNEEKSPNDHYENGSDMESLVMANSMNMEEPEALPQFTRHGELGRLSSAAAKIRSSNSHA